LTIAPAYRGSTASGQPYAIAPTRGVVQALIDRTTSLLTYLGDTFDWKAPDGTVALPGIAFAADTDTGFLRPAADQIGASTGGVQRWLLSDTGMSLTVPTLAPDGTASDPSLSFSADPDTGLYRGGADQIGAATGGAQRWLLSNTGMSLTVPVLAADGTAGAPALSFSADPDTGFLHPAADQIGASTGGMQRWLLSTSALTLTLPLLAADGTAGAPALSFSADPDTGLYRIAADTLGLATGGVAGLRLDASRRVIVGGASQPIAGLESALQVQGTTGQTAFAALSRYSADNGAPHLLFAKSRGASVGTNTVLQGGDNLGDIQFYGVSDTSAHVLGAGITATVEANPASGGMQTTLRVFTRNSGGTYAERLRLASSGALGIGTTGPTAPLHVNGAARVGSFTVATVPSASSMGAGAIIYVSNETDGAVLAFSDGTNWRRVTDRAIIS
jgi:hypothetical protein